MIKKLLLLTLAVSNITVCMQKTTGWAYKLVPDTLTIATTPDTNEAIKDITKCVPKILESVENSTEAICDVAGAAAQNISGALDTSVKKFCKSNKKNVKLLTATADKAIDTGLRIQVNPITINPQTIKTLCFSTTGVALAMAGIGLILYESFFVEDYATEVPQKPATLLGSVKNFAKNRYVLGSASIAAGLCLIAKSATL